MAKLTETELIRKVIEMLEKALLKDTHHETEMGVKETITYLLGRIDSLPE